MKRREFLAAAGASSVVVIAGVAKLDAGSAPAPVAPGWRRFEVTTRIEVLSPSGVTRAWVPLPLIADTDYQKRLGDTWEGQGARLHVWRDNGASAGVLCGEWPASASAPVLQVVSRFATRDRAVDVTAPAKNGKGDSMKAWLRPTRLIPTDGIVLTTAREITQGKRTDLEKARAIYEWVVENTFRDPKVRGCGLGDVRSMLESKTLGGKCADLNALFVGLARAAGIPAREVYGLRVAESKEFKSLGRTGDVTKAQHCRAEFHDPALGWVPVDPADVRKVILEEPPTGRTLEDPLVQHARQKLFGAWEMNYLAYNYAHDVRLPGASGGPLPFLMYPQCETAGGRRDCLDPASVKYEISARELTS